jgi:hypothetical protein
MIIIYIRTRIIYIIFRSVEHKTYFTSTAIKTHLPLLYLVLVEGSNLLFFVAMSDVDEERNRCVQLKLWKLNKKQPVKMNIHLVYLPFELCEQMRVGWVVGS